MVLSGFFGFLVFVVVVLSVCFTQALLQAVLPPNLKLQLEMCTSRAA